MEDLVSTFSVAAATDIEVLAEEFFTTITVHVNIRQLFVAEFTKEVTCTIATIIIIVIVKYLVGQVTSAHEQKILTGQERKRLDPAKYLALGRLTLAKNL